MIPKLSHTLLTATASLTIGQSALADDVDTTVNNGKTLVEQVVPAEPSKNTTGVELDLSDSDKPVAIIKKPQNQELEKELEKLTNDEGFIEWFDSIDWSQDINTLIHDLAENIYFQVLAGLASIFGVGIVSIIGTLRTVRRKTINVSKETIEKLEGTWKGHFKQRILGIDNESQLARFELRKNKLYFVIEYATDTLDGWKEGVLEGECEFVGPLDIDVHHQNPEDPLQRGIMQITISPDITRISGKAQGRITAYGKQAIAPAILNDFTKLN